MFYFCWSELRHILVSFRCSSSHPGLRVISYRNSPLQMVYKIGVLKYFSKFTKKHLCQSFIFNKIRLESSNLIKKGTLARILSRKFYENVKNSFSYRTPTMAASVAILHDSWRSTNYICIGLWIPSCVFTVYLMAKKRYFEVRQINWRGR